MNVKDSGEQPRDTPAALSPVLCHLFTAVNSLSSQTVACCFLFVLLLEAPSSHCFTGIWTQFLRGPSLKLSSSSTYSVVCRQKSETESGTGTKSGLDTELEASIIDPARDRSEDKEEDSERVETKTRKASNGGRGSS